MAIKLSPPQHGEVDARSASGGEVSPAKGTSPPDPLRGSTSPCWGGEKVVEIARSWIGTPYIHQASVKGAGCDCLGLLRGVWREMHGDEPEDPPPYSPDWAEAAGDETLYQALRRHLTPLDPALLAPGDVALFRVLGFGPAKHCGIIGEHALPHAGSLPPTRVLTLIHARQNRRVAEELFAPWRPKLAYAFRL